MSKFDCPWSLYLEIGPEARRIPLNLQHEEDLLGGVDDDIGGSHTLLFSSDVSETEWVGGMSDEKCADMLESQLNDSVVYKMPVNTPVAAQLFITGPNVRDESRFGVIDTERVGHPFKVQCAGLQQTDEGHTTRPITGTPVSPQTRSFPVAILNGSADSSGDVSHFDVFVYPIRVPNGSMARMMLDAYRAHNIMASCAEADALISAQTDEFDTQTVEAGAALGRAAGRVGSAAKSTASRAGRSLKRIGRAGRSGALRAGRGIRRAGTRLRGSGRARIGQARTRIGQARTRVSAQVSRLRQSRVGRAVGSRATKFKQGVRGRYTQLKQKLSRKNRNNKPVNPQQRGKVQRAIQNIRDKINRRRRRGRPGAAGAAGGAGGGAGGGELAGTEGGGGGGAQEGAGTGGEEGLPEDATLEDAATSQLPPPPLPAQPTPLNTAQETMLESAVSDGLVSQDQIVALRSSGVSSATTTGIPASVVSALVLRDQSLQRSVTERVQRTDPRRLQRYRQGMVGDGQMTLDEMEAWMTRGVAPARMPIPREPDPAEMEYARAYTPSQSVPMNVDQEESVPTEEEYADDEQILVPRSVLDLLVQSAQEYRQFRDKALNFTPQRSESNENTLALTTEQAEELLQLLEQESPTEDTPATAQDQIDLYTDAVADFVGLDDDDDDYYDDQMESDAASAAASTQSEHTDSITDETPLFVNTNDQIPLSVLLLGTEDSDRVPGIAGAMQFAYHLVSKQGEFVDTKLWHAVEASGEESDALRDVDLNTSYAELGSRVAKLAAAVSRQIHHPPRFCPVHGDSCKAH